MSEEWKSLIWIAIVVIDIYIVLKNEWDKYND